MKSHSTEKIYYFDYNATHPPFEETIQRKLLDYSLHFFNPSGATKFSLNRQSTIEDCRLTLSKITNKKKNNFIFCSTGTEANHLLIGHVSKKSFFKKFYISPFEHSAFEGALELYKLDFSYIPLMENGDLDLYELEKRFKNEPGIIACLLVGNETGTIFPYKEMYSIAKKYGGYFISDLMQGFLKTEIDFSFFDGFTFSGHKIGSGMGASAVYLDDSLISDYLLFKGGNQENGFRAGSENSFAISCLNEVSNLQNNSLIDKLNRLKVFQKKIETRIKSLECKIIEESKPRVPSTTFCLLPIEDIDFFMMGIESKNIVISTGASCKSRVREPSNTLLKLGYSEEQALRAIRISYGIFTTEDEIDYLLENIESTLSALS
jgi:cysteine desulfurase